MDKVVIIFGLIEWTLIVWFLSAMLWHDRGYKDGYIDGAMNALKSGESNNVESK